MIELYNKVAYTNPFPGLRSFEREDAYLFFGRDNQIRDLKQKLNDSKFLAIIGPSGSGKSSLVKAGLIPRMVSTSQDAPVHWLIAFLNPEATPVRNLARSIHQCLSTHNRTFTTHFTPELVETLLLTTPEILADWCEGGHLLLVIDQFEELFRYQQSDTQRDEITRFINLLLQFSHQPNYPVYVVLTMRSDYLDQCTEYEGLTEAINHGYYLLPKMNQEEIRQVVTTPVSVMGASITDSLTQRLLNDIGAKADQLPILQHALMRTWNYWQANQKTETPIDISDYEAIGTMQQAITQHAEEIYEALPDEKSRMATEKMFKALIVLGEGNEGLVKPAPVSQLCDISGIASYLLVDVLDRFREPNVAFLTPSTQIRSSSDPIIDLSHERILILWNRLQTWLKEETESAKLYKQASHSASLYHEGKTGVWVNPELQIGLKWLAENRPTQAWANRYDPYLERVINFLEYSRAQYDFDIENKETRQRNELRRARFFAIFLGASAVISLLFLLVSAVLRTRAIQSAEEAREEKVAADTQRKRAEEQTREAITQKKIAEQQEIITEQQKRLAEQAQKNEEVQKTLALKARDDAQKAQKSEEAQKQIALKARDDARKAQKNEEAQKQIALKAKDDALQAQKNEEAQKQIALIAKDEAQQQRGKAIARTVAIQSYQMTETEQDDLPALLAMEAYILNAKNKGPLDSPDIFNALAKAADVRTVLRRHTDVVRSIALAANAGDALLASGSDDGTVKLWQYDAPAQPPRSFATSTKAPDGIRSVVMDKDGKTLFGSSEKGLIYRWNTAQPDAQPDVRKAGNGPVQSLLLTPDNRQLISVSANGQVRTWRPTPTGLDSLLNIQSGMPLYCARLTPNGKYLLCGSNKGQLVRFDLTNPDKKPDIIARREFGSRVTALAFSPDGNHLVTGVASGQVYIWDFSRNEPGLQGTPLSGPHKSSVNDIAFTPNGNLLATCSSDWSIHVWDYRGLSQQQQPIVINDFEVWVLAIRFTNDGKRLIASGADKTIRIRNVDTADLYAELQKKVKRNLTVDEWNKYISKDIPYEKLTP